MTHRPCATKDCDADATYEVLWPGSTAILCAPCAERGVGVARAMGFALCPRALVEVERMVIEHEDVIERALTGLLDAVRRLGIMFRENVRFDVVGAEAMVEADVGLDKITGWVTPYEMTTDIPFVVDSDGYRRTAE